MNKTEIEKRLTLKEINKQIYAYWLEIKSKVERKRINKKPKGTFTRHNGNRRLALNTGWRYNNGLRSASLKRPSIGYKRSDNVRYRRHVDGLLFKLIHSPKELLTTKLTHSYEVFMLASRMSAKSRIEALKIAKDKQIPLYINKIKERVNYNA